MIHHKGNVSIPLASVPLSSYGALYYYKEKMPWCPCPLKNEEHRPGYVYLIMLSKCCSGISIFVLLYYCKVIFVEWYFTMYYFNSIL